MALHNEILVGRYNRFLQKLFQLKGGAPAPQLSSEIGVSHPLFHGHENRLIEGWTTYAFTINVGGVAAQANGFRLRNPAASNVIAVVEKMAFFGGVAAQPEVELESSNVDLGTPQQLLVKARDGRQGTSATSPLRASSAQPAVLLGTGAFVAQAAYGATSTVDVILNDDHQISIAPGFALNYTSNTQNVASGWVVFWRERALEELERTA